MRPENKEGILLHQRLRDLTAGFTFTGDLAVDLPAFLNRHGCPNTAAHSARVAAEAKRIALLAGADPGLAEAAGWLHDVSAVIAPAERIAAARDFGLNVLPEEEFFPLIVHQKLSVVLARELFGVSDPSVLGAIGCHTTLRADPTRMDKVLFVADKIEWDRADSPPYLDRLLAALAISLDEATLTFVTWMHEERATLRVVHPWLREAYVQLSGRPWQNP